MYYETMATDSTYSNGKIYAIRSPHTPLIYIGSSTQDLDRRFTVHLSDFKVGRDRTSSGEILMHDDCEIVLLESFPCNSREELDQREQEFINHYRDRCVNKHAAFSDLRRNDYLAYRRQRYQEHGSQKFE